MHLKICFIILLRVFNFNFFVYYDYLYEFYLTRFFNKIAIQARVQMAADKETVGFSRVHMYESKCILPLRDNCLFCS